MLYQKRIVPILLFLILPLFLFSQEGKTPIPPDEEIEKQAEPQKEQEEVPPPPPSPAEKAEESMEDARKAVTDAEAALREAQKAMSAAQRNLEDLPAAGETNRPHSFSLGTSFAMVADLCGLGVNITDAGMFPLHGESLAAACGFGDLLVSDGDAALAAYSTAATNPSTLKMVDEAQAGGPLIGADIGGSLGYDFTDWLGIPLFLRGGFHYVLKLTGGDQKVVLGTGPSDMGSASGYTAISGGSQGAALTTKWDSGWMEIPLSLGFCWEYKDKGKIYAGAGASWFSGGFSIGIDMDAAYAAFLTSYSTAPTDYSGVQVEEAVSETLRFQTSGLAPHLMLGIEAFAARDLVVFAEYWSSGYSDTVKTTQPLSDNLSRIVTAATQGPEIAQQDPDYIKHLTYPVSLQNISLTFGVKYYCDSLFSALFAPRGDQEISDKADPKGEEEEAAGEETEETEEGGDEER